MTWMVGGSTISDGEGPNSVGLRITAKTEPTSVLSIHDMPSSLRRGSCLRRDGFVTSSLSLLSVSVPVVLAIGNEVEDTFLEFELFSLEYCG